MARCHAWIDVVITAQKETGPSPTGAAAISLSQISGCCHNDLILAAHSAPDL